MDGSKQRTVLAALLLANGRVLSDSRLSHLLWGDNPPATVNAQIYTYVSRLRKYLGPQVDIRRRMPGYTMDIGSLRFDLREFEWLTRLGREALGRGEYTEAAELLRAALTCWRGPALAGVTEFLASAELHRLEEARIATVEERIEADLALGRHVQLVPELTGLVAEHPLREQLRAKLMIALYRSDRQSDALASYHEGRRILAEEMGADPTAMLAGVYHAILTGDPAVRSPAGVPHQPIAVRSQRVHPPELLPPDVSDFTGRSEELGRLRRFLLATGSGSAEPAPIPVVSGMAGVGKTALALRAAHAVRSEFTGGQLYAELGGTTAGPAADTGEVLGRFLQALGVDAAAIPAGRHERAQLYRSRLIGQRVLVLLDDAAHEEQVRPLLPGAPGCAVVITTRHRLVTLEGSKLIDLDVMDPEDALDLFTTIAGAERVEAEPGSAKQLVDLCGRLPLGLRIAGARLAARPHWPLSRLADRLDVERRRLNELRLGTMDVRASISASYERLDEHAKQTLQGLSLLSVPDFPSWTVAALLGASSAVGEDVAESLVDARLLEASKPDDLGRLRYRFHQLVRLFAREAAAEH